jgi:hypothetical protein
MKARSPRPANTLPTEQPAPVIAEEPEQPAPPQQVVPQQQITPPQQAEAEPEQPQPPQSTEQPTTEHLLSSILDQLKMMQRANMFGEFSVTRLIAGILQGLVFLCLLASIWFLMSPTKQFNQVLISIGFAILLQLMALTFYIMRGPR